MRTENEDPLSENEATETENDIKLTENENTSGERTGKTLRSTTKENQPQHKQDLH